MKKKNNKDDNIFYSVKFIIIGDQSVGKTNIIHRFCKGQFSNQYSITIGMDYLSYYLEINKKIFHLQLWDTAGSERFRSVSKGYYKNSACAIIVYDITEKKSFLSIKKWIEDCKTYSNNNLHLVLVGNKNDLNDSRQVTEEEGETLALEYGMSFFESSALNGKNINEIFYDSSKVIYDNIINEVYDFDDPHNGIKICQIEDEITIDKKLKTSDNQILDKSIFTERSREDTSHCC